jgi:hypothetical protein
LEGAFQTLQAFSLVGWHILIIATLSLVGWRILIITTLSLVWLMLYYYCNLVSGLADAFQTLQPCFWFG